MIVNARSQEPNQRHAPPPTPVQARKIDQIKQAHATATASSKEEPPCGSESCAAERQAAQDRLHYTMLARELYRGQPDLQASRVETFLWLGGYLTPHGVFWCAQNPEFAAILGFSVVSTIATGLLMAYLIVAG